MARARRKAADTATRTSPEKARQGAGGTPTAPAGKSQGAQKPRPSQKGAKKRVRVSKGVYRDRWGLAATVKVNDIQREHRFPRGTPLRTIQAWRDEMRGNLRTLPKGAKHTLRHDAGRYLKQKEGQLVSINDRRRSLGMWLERFGHLRTLVLEQHVPELNAQLDSWRKEKSGATCNHRRDALMNLVRVLYGDRAATGLSDLVTFRKAPPKPRWLNRTHIADVLARLEPGTKLSARLHLMHWTGMRPAQIRLLTPDNFHLNHKVPHVVSPRVKNGIVGAIPLLEDGLRAARQFIDLDAFGKWRTEPANKALAKAAEKAGRKRFTTYQIRHSFATGLRQSGADIADIQEMYGHTNPETTKIYAPAALEKNQKAIERLRAADQQGADENASS